jgi:hypothetical protein
MTHCVRPFVLNNKVALVFLLRSAIIIFIVTKPHAHSWLNSRNVTLPSMFSEA